MNDVAGSRIERLREKSKEWFDRATAAAPGALTLLSAIIAIALAIVVAWAAVLILGRAGEQIADTLTSGAPLLGQVLGYLFMAALLAAGVGLFFVTLTAVVRLSAWALAAIASRTANKTSPQSERYVTAGLIALLPAAGVYFVATQPAFQALPLELKQHLIPVLLPFAIGVVAAPLSNRGQAITLTLLALLTVTGIVAATGYLSPSPQPMAAAWHWADLMRQSEPLQRLWWMLLVLFAALIWVVAVFAGSREGSLDDRPRSSIRFNDVLSPSPAS
ncbi:hypothetical protein [Terricaulis silvestris]|uniref:Uncharacterized protein n=1 Tax=Terricaulis silvestris TaxID=2686094 RepID=A0A6I6MP20_9CAUL|nr:hypothetical protein [Terricaulis silvestris]QGZ93292.1 hypothetical protein DSM104635_00101 [Terricaulis silvestris]